MADDKATIAAAIGLAERIRDLLRDNLADEERRQIIAACCIMVGVELEFDSIPPETAKENMFTLVQLGYNVASQFGSEEKN
jgi:hypothetical protein